MSFISYAQNFEDVMLWRALGHIEEGFYIDVGAFSPDADSVTRAFYDRGWRGINIEPDPRYLEQLNAKRSEDKNLGIAVSDANHTLQLHITDVPGLTTVQSKLARSLQYSGISSEIIDVPAQTLTRLWQDQIDPLQQVHFLKVDVEGNEKAVLHGLDWTRFRPWVVVVEATSPMTKREVYSDWEHILLEADYLMAYWDGLNRFYVAKEHDDLLDAFSAPPNVFDEFVLARFVDPLTQKQSEVANLLSQVERLRSEADTAEIARREAESARREAESARREAESARREAESARREAEDKLGFLAAEIATLQDTIETLTRPIWKKLLFRSSGKPRKAFRWLLFHKSGKPRDAFKRIVLKKNGRPRGAFRRWMESKQYHASPRGAQSRPRPSLTPRGQYFLTRLKAVQSRRRGD